MTTFDEHADQAIGVTRADPIAHLDWQITCGICNTRPATHYVAVRHNHPSRTMCGDPLLLCDEHKWTGDAAAMLAAPGDTCKDHRVSVTVTCQALGGAR